MPESGSVQLIKSGAPVKDLPAAGAAFVRRLIKTYEPSLIVREAPLPPRFNGFSNTKTFVSQHFLHGAVIAIAGFYGVDDVDADVTTWRKFFCGRSTANPASKRGVMKSSRQKTEDRTANKAMVLHRAKLLGYLPIGCEDTDRADACGIWEFGCGTYGRAAPAPLVMYEACA